MRILLIVCLFLSLPLQAAAQPPHLLFDQGHRQVFVIDQAGPLHLGGLARMMEAEGWGIGISQEELTEQSLKEVDALIISGAFQPLNPPEIDAVESFLHNGGRLAVMLHIYQPLVPLLQRLGVAAGNGVIREQQNRFDDQPGNFLVTDFKQHPLTREVKQFAIYGGWPLRSQNDRVEVLARCSPQAWLDSDNDQHLSDRDQVSPFAVLVSGTLGQGAFAVFADDAIFQNKFLTSGNLVLARNLARWLKGEGGSLTAN